MPRSQKSFLFQGIFEKENKGGGIRELSGKVRTKEADKMVMISLKREKSVKTLNISLVHNRM